jgi:CubicO group peptidase (beta-lactamase class C family)
MSFFSCTPDNSLDKEMNRLISELEIDQKIDTDSLLIQMLDYFNLPGLAVGVINSESTVDINCKGYSDTELNKALTPYDCFDINSVTKSTTALLIARLVDGGFVSYQSTMSEIFPEIKVKIHDDFKKVTIEDILHHESGLSRNGRHLEERSRPIFEGDYMNDRHQLAIWILQYPASETYGEYHYSNVGYVILGSIVEKFAEQSWENQLEDELLLPLGLSSACFEWPPLNSDAYAIGHTRAQGGAYHQRESYDSWYLYGIGNPMGGLNLSITDFSKYASFQLAGLNGQSEFLSVKQFQEMHRISVLHGHGWFASEYKAYPGSVHDGSDDGYYSKIFISQELDLGIVVLTNIDDENAWRACNLITYVLLRKYTITY